TDQPPYPVELSSGTLICNRFFPDLRDYEIGTDSRRPTYAQSFFFIPDDALRTMPDGPSSTLFSTVR
ncbi:unnamed protein product, partial [Sphenostylis stenocarpa]